MGQPIPQPICCADEVCASPVAEPVDSSLAGFFGNLFNTSTYPPRWQCGSWSALEGWLHIVADLMIFGAYFAIPIALVYFILRRRDFPFHSIFFLFGAFILLCGMTHLVEAIIFYYPIYRVQGLLKLLTGIVSVCTFLVLLRLLPKLLDLPKLATINAKLREADTAKSNFLANMSHEIRTPMTAIIGYADVLLDEPSENDREAASHIIKRNGEHLLSIVNDILDLSKIESGNITIERLPVAAKEILEGPIELIRVKADAKQLKLSAQFDPDLPKRLSVDVTRLRQVLINLIGNAIKFTERGEVSASLAYDESAATLRCVIKDTGKGMAPETVKRLGEPFYQADNSICRNYGGTGLGMAICFRLVEMMGGRMTVQSEINVGTEITLLIPAERVNSPKPTNDESVAATTGLISSTELPLQDVRILLVEDGPDNQRLISMMLRKAGAVVELVENGKEAVERVFSSNPDLPQCDVILMDMQMPIMDGYQATRLLRQRGSTAPIIAVTAHAMADDENKCLEAGCDAYLSKPIDRKRLIQIVHAFVKESTYSY